MAEILAPGFEGFCCLANCLSEANQGISEAVWVEVGQPCVGKRLSKDFSNGSSRTPIFPVQSFDCKMVRILV